MLQPSMLVSLFIVLWFCFFPSTKQIKYLVKLLQTGAHSPPSTFLQQLCAIGDVHCCLQCCLDLSQTVTRHLLLLLVVIMISSMASYIPLFIWTWLRLRLHYTDDDFLLLPHGYLIWYRLMWSSWHSFQWSHPTGQQWVGWEYLTQNLKNILTMVEWVLASHTCKAFASLPYMPRIFLWKQYAVSLMVKVPLFCPSSNAKTKCTRVESKENPRGRSIEAFTMHAGMESEKQKLCWRENWQGVWRAIRKVSLGIAAKKKTKEKSGWLEKVPDDSKKWLVFRKEKENWGDCRYLQVWCTAAGY